MPPSPLPALTQRTGDPLDLMGNKDIWDKRSCDSITKNRARQESTGNLQANGLTTTWPIIDCSQIKTALTNYKKQVVKPSVTTRDFPAPTLTKDSRPRERGQKQTRGPVKAALLAVRMSLLTIPQKTNLLEHPSSKRITPIKAIGTTPHQ